MTNAPVFYQDIKPLFSQWERIQMMFYCDFWDYEQVKARASSIHLSLQPAQPGANPGGWSKLPQVHIMPVGTGPWAQEKIDLFGAWIKEGCLEGTPPPKVVPGDLVPAFTALSKALTGFDDLDILSHQAVLAQTYIDRIKAETNYGDTLTEILGLIKGGETGPFLCADGKTDTRFIKYDALFRTICTLWYTAAIDGTIGTPAENQYVQGLQWQAMRAHPMGFANEILPFYWQFEPEDSLQYTGLLKWTKTG